MRKDLTSSEINEEGSSEPVLGMEQMESKENQQPAKKEEESDEPKNQGKFQKVWSVHKLEKQRVTTPAENNVGSRYEPDIQQHSSGMKDSSSEQSYTKYLLPPLSNQDTVSSSNTKTDKAPTTNSNGQTFSQVQYLTPGQLSKLEAPEGYDFAQFPAQPQYKPFYYSHTGFPNKPRYYSQLNQRANQPSETGSQLNQQYQAMSAADQNRYSAMPTHDMSELQHNTKQFEEHENSDPVAQKSSYEPLQSTYNHYDGRHSAAENDNMYYMQPQLYMPVSGPSTNTGYQMNSKVVSSGPKLSSIFPFNIAKYSPYSNVAGYSYPVEEPSQNQQHLQGTNTPSVESMNMYGMDSVPTNNQQYSSNIITQPQQGHILSKSTHGPLNHQEANNQQYYPQQETDTINEEEHQGQPLPSSNSQSQLLSESQETAPSDEEPKIHDSSYSYYPFTYNVPNLRDQKSARQFASYTRRPVYTF